MALGVDLTCHAPRHPDGGAAHPAGRDDRPRHQPRAHRRRRAAVRHACRCPASSIGACSSCGSARPATTRVGFAVHVPHYLAGPSAADGALAALNAIVGVTGLNLPNDDLVAAGRTEPRPDRRARSRGTTRSRAVVAALEQQYDTYLEGRQRPSLLATERVRAAVGRRARRGLRELPARRRRRRAGLTPATRRSNLTFAPDVPNERRGSACIAPDASALSPWRRTSGR